MLSQISSATSALHPFETAPSTNWLEKRCMISGFFLPIALRRLSASFSEKFASVFEMSITCSWYTMHP